MKSLCAITLCATLAGCASAPFIPWQLHQHETSYTDGQKVEHRRWREAHGFLHGYEVGVSEYTTVPNRTTARGTIVAETAFTFTKKEFVPHRWRRPEIEHTITVNETLYDDHKERIVSCSSGTFFPRPKQCSFDEISDTELLVRKTLSCTPDLLLAQEYASTVR